MKIDQQPWPKFLKISLRGTGIFFRKYKYTQCKETFRIPEAVSKLKDRTIESIAYPTSLSSLDSTKEGIVNTSRAIAGAMLKASDNMAVFSIQPKDDEGNPDPREGKFY